MRTTKDILLTIEDGVPFHLVKIACDSTEIASLPTTGIADGSNALATNTGEVYFFNEKSSKWKKV